MTVAELVDKYIHMKRTVKVNTMKSYGSSINRIRNSGFGQKKIKSVKTSDAKMWYIELHDQGLKRSTITGCHSILRPAFEMAVEDDILRKNPFHFKLADLLPDDSEKRVALNEKQQEFYLDFIKENGTDNYYDDIVILLGTGLRVSELYGLTKDDLNFEKRCFYVRKQLCRRAGNSYFIAPPKTKSGIHRVPMSDEVYEAFRRVVKNRPIPKIERLIDGYSGFVFLDKDGNPKVGMHLQNYMRHMQEKMSRQYGNALPSITPHVLRHTFCTRMAQAGIDVKSLQYLMGHSNANVTMDVYTHSDSDFAEKAFRAVAGGR